MPEDYELWIFPTLADKRPLEQEPPSDDIILNPQATTEAINPPEAQQELIHLQALLEKKIELLAGVHKQYTQKIQEFDSDFLEKMVGLIQKTTQKLIEKEIRSDKTTLVKMIESTLKNLEDHQECELSLSSEDYALWSDEALSSLNLKVREDPDLKIGDYKILTKTGEIAAIIDERLQTLFG
ncbi:MAG: FliH/SctL family protein [Legionellales bacterium]